MLFYFLKQESSTVLPYSTDFEYAVEKFMLHGFESDLITVSFAHYQSLEVIFIGFLKALAALMLKKSTIPSSMAAPRGV